MNNADIKKSVLLGIVLGIIIDLICVAGIVIFYNYYNNTYKVLKINYEQLTSDFIKAELIYEPEHVYPRVYETRYLLTEEEASQVLTDISDMTFEIVYGPTRIREESKYSIKLTYTNRIMLLSEWSITYLNVQETDILHNYKEYSKYPSYNIDRNDDFMAILQFYISKDVL